jgi:hypothetical protein
MDREAELYTMDVVLGLLAFAGLIAAQFLAVVVVCSERFENDPAGAQRSEPGIKRGRTISRRGAPIIRPLPALCSCSDSDGTKPQQARQTALAREEPDDDRRCWRIGSPTRI